jgi:hypothetical protein
VQTEAHTKDLQVQHLRGLARHAPADDDAQAFASAVIGMACDPSCHVALTPALALERKHAEVRLRWTKYTVCTAVALGGVALLYSLAFHRSKASEETAERKSTASAGLTRVEGRGASGSGDNGSVPRWSWQR